MSTIIAEIIGSKEMDNDPNTLVPQILTVIKAWGGDKHGPVIQLTLEDKYIVLREEEIARLIKVLQEYKSLDDFKL